MEKPEQARTAVRLQLGLGRRLLVLLAIVALVYAYNAYDLGRYLTLQELKSRREAIVRLYDGHPLETIGAYSVVYVVATALSLPGATILSLAAGAVFGLAWGTVVVSLASTIGATCAFLIARFLLRDVVQTRFADRLDKINDGIRGEGAFYLFALRLVPVFPFFVINLGMALTPIDTGTFFAISQVGMLPGTLAYVNAGTQLAKIDSHRGILSPGLLVSFALLGLLPFLGRRAVESFRARRFTATISDSRRRGDAGAVGSQQMSAPASTIEALRQ